MKLPKVYEPAQYEGDIYALWEKSGAFRPTGEGEPYSIVMPPPNANANLHIGYALTAALEDILARYHRIKGGKILLLPGADHAGFETQVVYERRLEREGQSRFDFTREELYKQIWDFVANNRVNFETQFRKLGIGCDWSKFAFTLDEKIVKRAYTTFKKMWDEGLIYRGERLVNFCTFHGTAFADIEVEYREEHGHLWQISYPLADGNGEIVVATTRPETMLGDTAVAVNPKDPRYKKFVGKTVKLPLTSREVPIITDEFVDQKFGTGAVKITPAHDPNDFGAAQRHDLPMISVIDTEGKMVNVPETYRGLEVNEARKRIVKDLEDRGNLVKAERYTHNVGHCYKCGNVIQPLLREQWFVDMQPLAERAIKSLRGGKIKFYPQTKKEQIVHYLEGLRDWNISRQIAWGIPIPAFQSIDNPDEWIYDGRVDEETIEVGGKIYHRDPDVFDTWFSSSSWPYATLDFPEGKDFNEFYPLSVMETGGEILYPWVSRMIMLGLYVTGEIPFKAVYIHGYVMAEDGSKMSKSVGNVIDPLEVIEKYGSDALRMGIISGRAAAVNRGYDQRRVEEARNFCNKLWNIARYIEGVLGDSFNREEPGPKSIADHWILSCLDTAQIQITEDLENYRFAEAYERLYHFVWDDLADWYIEASKSEPNKPLLAYLLEQVLTLAHPFAPFLTETIWQTLAWEPDSILAKRQLQKVVGGDQQAASDFEGLKDLITEARYIVQVTRKPDAALTYKADELVKTNEEIIKRLAGLKVIRQGEGGNLKLTSTRFEAWLDVDAKKYTEELGSKKDAAEDLVGRLKVRLANKSYVENAPAAIVEQTQQQLTEAEQQLEAVEQEFKRYNP